MALQEDHEHRSVGTSVDAYSSSSSDKDSDWSSAMAPVEDPHYIYLNLHANNIWLRDNALALPQRVAALVSRMGSGRESPRPTMRNIMSDPSLRALAQSPTEVDVEDYFKQELLPDLSSSGDLQRSKRLPMEKHTIVGKAGAVHKVSTPVPDLLYGYPLKAFEQQLMQISTMSPPATANSRNLMYPFLAVEFKGDEGKMLTATNQCLGGSSSCANMVEQLNQRLRDNSGARDADSTVFSIAARGSEVRLFVTWVQRDDDEVVFNMQLIKHFLITDARHYREFRKYIRNILAWGEGDRLRDIQRVLDQL